jgi:membrane protein required for colicin V production
MEWHWVDYVIMGVIGLSVITGLFRGFVKELIALVVWGLAIWLAYSYSQNVDQYLQPYIHDKHIRLAASFIGVLLATLIAGAIVNAILSFILSRSGLSGTDRLLGMGFGLVRGVFIVALIMLVVKISDVTVEDYSKKSKLYANFDPLVSLMYSYVPDYIIHKKVPESLEENRKVVEDDDGNIKTISLLQELKPSFEQA